MSVTTGYAALGCGWGTAAYAAKQAEMERHTLGQRQSGIPWSELTRQAMAVAGGRWASIFDSPVGGSPKTEMEKVKCALSGCCSVDGSELGRQAPMDEHVIPVMVLGWHTAAPKVDGFSSSNTTT